MGFLPDWLAADPVKQAFVEGKDPVRDWVVEILGEKVGGAIFEGAKTLLVTLNSNSPEIVTVCVIVCGFGIMVAPLFGGNQGKWFGRLAGALAIGTVWRILI